MNKVDFNLLGGYPLELDDLIFEQNAVRSGFSDIGKAMADGTDPIILHGCVVTDAGSTFDITAGAIFYEGETFNFPSHSVAKLAGAGTYYWRIVETADAAGNETFEDTSTKDTYFEREIRMLNSDIDTMGGTDFDITTDPTSVTKKFSDIFTLKSVHDTLRSDFTTIQLGSQRSGILFYNQPITSSLGSWTALTPGLIELSGNTFVISGTQNLKIPPNAWVKISISHVDTGGTDWLRFEGLSASGSNNYIIGGSLTIDGSGNLDWIDTDPREFMIKNKTGSNQVLTIKIKLETKFSIVIQTVTNL